jgi:hypothetical protein
MGRKLLFEVTIKDCEVQYFRGSGPGGQKKNKTNSAVRVIHKPSNAVGQASETRSQLENKRLAFKRMAESKEFQIWTRIEAGVYDYIDDSMKPENLLVEVQENGKWQKWVEK